MLHQPAVSPTPAALPHGERRVRVRYPAAFLTLCQEGNPGVADFWWMARVQDISTKGIGFIVREPFPLDSLIVIEPTDPSATPSASLQARVVRTENRGAEGWSIGCEFTTDLTDADVRALLG